jgi:hypothetical protein
MAKTILIDEIHVSMRVPDGLGAAEYAAIRRILGGVRFRARLGPAVRDVVRRYPSLRTVRIALTR